MRVIAHRRSWIVGGARAVFRQCTSRSSHDETAKLSEGIRCRTSKNADREGAQPTRRIDALLGMLLALALTGCIAKKPPVPDSAPAPSIPPPGVPARPVAPAAPPKPKEPAVLKDGLALRLVGIQDAKFVDWAPSGKTALVEASPALYRLRLDTQEVHPMPDLGSVQKMGWAGPDEALLVRWSADVPAVGELSLLTGEWRPLAGVSGRLQICQSSSHWVWVDVNVVRQGGAGSLEIGAVYRTPAPKPAESGAPKPLDGKRVLERGALLGRLADGSCLLDGLDQRLMLLRPNGDLQIISKTFSLPEVTRDGRGVIWLEKAGRCPDCIELGPGVPFQHVVWWRLDGKKLTANLGRPQVISFLLSPDGERLIIGHRDYKGSGGAISVLSSEGFQPGKVRTPALVPVGWMGSDLLAQPAGPERWTYRSPIFRVEDGKQVAEWLASGVNGSLMIDVKGEVRYLTPEGAAYRLSHPEPFLAGGQGVHALGIYQPQAPYVSVPQGDGLLLVRLEGP